MVMFFMATVPLQMFAQHRDRGHSNSRPEVIWDRQHDDRHKDKKKNIGTISRDNAHFKKEKRKVVMTRHRPSGAERIVYNNRTYDYSNGRFYSESRGRYYQAPPPRGMRIRTLPAGYVRVSVGNVGYCFFEGVFYMDRHGYYEVVNPEIGTVVDALPADYERVVYNGDTFYEYNGVLYDKVPTFYGMGYQVVGYIG